MTVKEIIENAQALTGQFISTPMAIRHINNAVQFLKTRYDTANITNTMEIDTEADKPISLPDDCLGVIKVVHENRPYYDYVVVNNSIIFKDNGKFTLYLQRMPMAVETEHDEPDLPVQYHSILELYLASRMVQPIDREREQEFWVLAEQIHRRLQRMKRRNLRIPARVWR